jgi:hypothetical protein
MALTESGQAAMLHRNKPCPMSAQLHATQRPDSRDARESDVAAHSDKLRGQHARERTRLVEQVVRCLCHQARILLTVVKRRSGQRDDERAGIQVPIEDMALRAPVRGRIEYRMVEPGSVIPSGGRVATLLNTSAVRLTVFLPTDVAGKLKLVDEARIVLDAAPQFVIPATASFVAAETQFTPKYVETASEREKLVFRVKMKVPPEITVKQAAYVNGPQRFDGQSAKEVARTLRSSSAHERNTSHRPPKPKVGRVASASKTKLTLDPARFRWVSGKDSSSPPACKGLRC